MNILITAIGSFAAEAAITSLLKKPGIEVVGCDMYPANWNTNTTLVHHFYQIPPAREETAFLQALLDICQRQYIDIIFPLTDPEVDVLSVHREVFAREGVQIALSPAPDVAVCRDKWLLFKKFQQDSSVQVIPTVELHEYPISTAQFPLVLKPRRGRSSEGLRIVNTLDELVLWQRTLQDFIVQPFLPGYIHVVDVVRQADGTSIVALARKELIRTKNGAGMSVETVNHPTLLQAARHIANELHICGCINIEFIYHNHRFYLMDINPRFSAGIAFSIQAGYDVVSNHLNCFTNTPIEAQPRFQSLTMARRLVEVITSSS